MRGDEKDQGVWRHPFSPCHPFQVVSGLLLRLVSVFGSYGIPLFMQPTKTEKVMCVSVDRVVEGTGHSLLSGGILPTGSFLISHTLFSSFVASVPSLVLTSREGRARPISHGRNARMKKQAVKIVGSSKSAAGLVLPT